jgi:hypothetical protein
VNQNFNPQLQASADAAKAMAGLRSFVLSPEGRAGCMLGGMLLLEIAVLVFAAAGGALGARMIARSRRREG